MDVFYYGFAVCETCGEKFSPAAYEPIDICASCRSNTMAIHGATTALLQSILDTVPALKGVTVVIATDYPAELADEMREPVTEAYEPTAKESEWLGTQIALVFGVCDLTVEQINVEEWQKETEATRRMDEPR